MLRFYENALADFLGSQVADAQKMELALSAGLTGNPATDSSTVQTLLSDFAGGMRQNMQNLLDVIARCLIQIPCLLHNTNDLSG